MPTHKPLPACSACESLIASEGVDTPHLELRRYNEAVPGIVVYKCRSCNSLLFHNSKNKRWL